MRNRRLSFFVAVGASLALFACAQGKGERCQVGDDCSSSLVCVNTSGVVPDTPPVVEENGTVVDPEGHCCPTCSPGSPRWDSSKGDKGDCSCGASTPDPVVDGGVDGGDSSVTDADNDASDVADAADATDVSDSDSADVSDSDSADGSLDG